MLIFTAKEFTIYQRNVKHRESFPCCVVKSDRQLDRIAVTDGQTDRHIHINIYFLWFCYTWPNGGAPLFIIHWYISRFCASAQRKLHPHTPNPVIRKICTIMPPASHPMPPDAVAVRNRRTQVQILCCENALRKC